MIFKVLHRYLVELIHLLSYNTIPNNETHKELDVAYAKILTIRNEVENLRIEFFNTAERQLEYIAAEMSDIRSRATIIKSSLNSFSLLSHHYDDPTVHVCDSMCENIRHTCEIICASCTVFIESEKREKI
jgi:hypothetical protein